MRWTRLLGVGILLLLIPVVDNHVADLQAETPVVVEEESCPALNLDSLTNSDSSGVTSSLPTAPDTFEAAAACLTDATAEPTLTPGETVIRGSREWTLWWSDEFEGPAGTAIDDDDWTCETGGQGWGNQELEYYTDRVENVALDGRGFLQITAQTGQPDDGETCWYGQCAYTSARCITQNKVEFTYGWVEARLKIPFGQGLWPAFWMLGADFSKAGWPGSGEIDIMENIGSEPQTVHGTIHGPGYSGAQGIGHSFEIDADFADDFHLFALEWDPEVIRWYVDGELYSTLSVADLGGHNWVFNHDFFIIMNVAVGGGWPGYPDETTIFPQQMQVDYVRVYQPAQ